MNYSRSGLGYSCRGEEWQYGEYPPAYAGFIPGEEETEEDESEVRNRW